MILEYSLLLTIYFVANLPQCAVAPQGDGSFEVGIDQHKIEVSAAADSLTIENCEKIPHHKHWYKVTLKSVERGSSKTFENRILKVFDFSSKVGREAFSKELSENSDFQLKTNPKTHRLEYIASKRAGSVPVEIR